METCSIEKEFGAAMRFAEQKKGRGFQAAVSRISGADTSNLNSIVKRDKGASEQARRRIFRAVLSILPDIPAKNYEDFLHLGRWILDGNEPEQWKPPLRGHLATALVHVPTDISKNIASPPEPSRPPHSVPVISWVQAGEWSCVADPFHPGDAEERVSTTETAHPNA